MFDDNKRRDTETVIGPSVRVEGNFVGAGDVVVEGQLTGTLKTDKSLRIGEAAKLKADVEAADILVAGEVRGNVRTKGKLSLAATGKIFGNVEAASLSVMEGAVLHGKCSMATGAEPVEVPVKRNHKEPAV